MIFFFRKPGTAQTGSSGSNTLSGNVVDAKTKKEKRVFVLPKIHVVMRGKCEKPSPVALLQARSVFIKSETITDVAWPYQ